VPHLRLEGVVKRFGDHTALAGVEMDVEEGEFFVLLGPSAAGKTTTLRAIAGLEACNAGRILFAGEDYTRRPVRDRPMAMIFQTFALYPHLTVRANLGYPLREAGVDRSETARRVDEIASMLRLSHTLDRKPSTLSGGEQQRVAIGRALIRRPKLLLLDEPLTNLDAKLRHDTRAELKRLHRELGMTMVFATPDQLEALSMGQRIGVLRDGRIVQTGTPEALYERPNDRFVATLVGAPAMNLVPAEWAGAQRTDAIRLPFMSLDVGARAGDLGRLPAGSPLFFGIRPHDLAPVDGDADGPGFDGPIFDGRVHLTEPLGDVTVLDIEAGGTLVKMIVAEERGLAFRPGDPIRVRVDLDEAHFFHRETGVALAR